MHQLVDSFFAYLQKGIAALLALVSKGSHLLKSELHEAGLGEGMQNVVQMVVVGVLLLLAFRVLGTALSLILALVLLLLAAEAFFPDFAATMKHIGT